MGLCEKQREVDVCLYWLTLLRFSVRAAGSHAHLQSGLSDRDRPGISAQEEHHLLWPQVRQHPGVVSGAGGVRQRQAVRLRHLTPVLPRGSAGVEGTPGYQAPEIRPGIVYDEKVRTDLMSLIGCPCSFSVTAKVKVCLLPQLKLNSDSEDTCFLSIQSLNSRHDHIQLVNR